MYNYRDDSRGFSEKKQKKWKARHKEIITRLNKIENDVLFSLEKINKMHNVLNDILFRLSLFYDSDKCNINDSIDNNDKHEKEIKDDLTNNIESIIQCMKNIITSEDKCNDSRQHTGNKINVDEDNFQQALPDKVNPKENIKQTEAVRTAYLDKIRKEFLPELSESIVDSKFNKTLINITDIDEKNNFRDELIKKIMVMISIIIKRTKTEMENKEIDELINEIYNTAWESDLKPFISHNTKLRGDQKRSFKQSMKTIKKFLVERNVVTIQ